MSLHSSHFARLVSLFAFVSLPAIAEERPHDPTFTHIKTTFSGQCGADRYEIRLTEMAPRKGFDISAITAEDKPLSSAQLQKIRTFLQNGQAIMRGEIHQCLVDGRHGALVRLTVSPRPISKSDFEFVDIEVFKTGILGKISFN